MDAAETSTLIRARCPELSSRDLEAIEAALSGEEMLPMKRARSGPGAAREARGASRGRGGANTAPLDVIARKAH